MPKLLIDDPAAATEKAVAPGWRRFVLGRTLTDADLRGEANLFTPLRWLLASAVIYTHAYGLTGFDRDPLTGFLPFPVSRLAVLLFFTLSGFMITGSFLRRGLGSFVAARALRLLPGLWVMLVVTTLVLGLALSTVPPAEFFTVANLSGYVGHNALLIGGGDYRLAGVFDRNSLPTVNGSLWSIPQEVHCYVSVAVFGLAGLFRRRALFLAAFVVLVGFALTPWGQAIGFVALAVSFYAGVVMYVWRARLVLSWPLAIAGLVVAFVVPPGAVDALITALAFAYALVVAAVLVPARWKRAAAHLPDYSYGIYIYAFPVQQVVVATGLGTTAVANMAVSLTLTLPLAALSWHLVEKPALSLKARTSRRRPPATHAPAA